MHYNHFVKLECIIKIKECVSWVQNDTVKIEGDNFFLIWVTLEAWMVILNDKIYQYHLALIEWFSINFIFSCNKLSRDS